MKITKSKMQELLALIAKEELKEKKTREGLENIVEGNGFVDITAGMFEAIKILLPVGVYDWLSYYLWECSRKWEVTLWNGKKYVFTTDEQFIEFLVATEEITDF